MDNVENHQPAANDQVNKFAAYTAIAGGALGLLAELLAFLTVDYESIFGKILISFKAAISPPLMLGFFRGDGILSYSADSGTINYLHLTLYSLLLMGGYFYMKSQGRERRLIRFAFATVFFTGILGMFGLFTFPFLYAKYSSLPGFSAPAFLAGYGSTAVWIYLAYKAVKALHVSRLQAPVESKFISPTPYRSTPKDQRAFHYIIDCIIAGATGLAFFYYNLSFVFPRFDDKSAVYIVYSFSIIIYYIICETTLGTTPGKLLTGNRVVDMKGGAPSKAQIIGRNFARFIPFNPFSHLLTEKGSGWHDRVSGTTVVKEESTGVKGARYMLFIPVILVIYGSTWLGYEMYDSYRSGVERERLANEEREMMLEQVNHISENTIIHLGFKGYSGEEGYFYMKPELVEQDSILFNLVKLDHYTNDFMEVARECTRQAGAGNIFWVHKDQLRKSLDFDTENSWDRYVGENLIPEKDKVYIKYLKEIGKPVFGRSPSGSSSRNSLHLWYRNEGYDVKLTDVKVVSGEFTSVTTVPQEIKYNQSLNIGFEAYNREEGFELILTLENEFGHSFRYRLKGSGIDNCTLKPAEDKEMALR